MQSLFDTQKSLAVTGYRNGYIDPEGTLWKWEKNVGAVNAKFSALGFPTAEINNPRVKRCAIDLTMWKKAGVIIAVDAEVLRAVRPMTFRGEQRSLLHHSKWEVIEGQPGWWDRVKKDVSKAAVKRVANARYKYYGGKIQ